jgi:hypothetical protein
MAGRRGDSAAAPLLENKAAPASASEAEAGGGYHHHNNNYYYYVDGCPGCAVDRRKAASPGIPYANFIYVWIVTLCTGTYARLPCHATLLLQQSSPPPPPHASIHTAQISYRAAREGEPKDKAKSPFPSPSA